MTQQCAARHGSEQRHTGYIVTQRAQLVRLSKDARSQGLTLSKMRTALLSWGFTG
jgi:hypothetical protein